MGLTLEAPKRKRRKTSKGAITSTEAKELVKHGLPAQRKYAFYFLGETALAAPTDMSGCEMDPATVDCLNGMPQLAANAEARNGKSIVMHELFIKGYIKGEAAIEVEDFGAEHMMTIWVIVNKNTGNSTYSSDNVLFNPSELGLLAPCAFRAWETKDNYTTLWQRTFIFPKARVIQEGIEDADFTYSARLVTFQARIPLFGLKTTYDSTGATVQSINNNSLHLMACTNTVPISSGGTNISYNARLIYTG